MTVASSKTAYEEFHDCPLLSCPFSNLEKRLAVVIWL
jgi:hypothetical protein